jgi:putative SOS response-associated peptidase YedK
VEETAVCGRFTLTAAPEDVERAFGLDETPQLRPRFNIAPGQDVATIHRTEGGRSVLQLRRWGLVPFWAKDPGIGARLINARGETLDAKPSFREAFRRRRCLVPADGFYEWAAVGSGPRQPYWVARADGACFAIAGLYERWKSPQGESLETCTLITTDANERLRTIHHRMPVILAPADYGPWLDASLYEPERLRALLNPRPHEGLELRAVSRRVNRPEHDDPACIAPLQEAAPA